jgi:hypothetical protein
MNEKIFLRALLLLMTSGLVAIVVVPAAHIGRTGFAVGKVLAFGILAILIYFMLRKRFELRSFSRPGPFRSSFWLLLSAPSIILVAAVGTDIYNRQLSPFTEAMRVINQSEVVRAEIGKPVRIGWPMEGTDGPSEDHEQRLMRVAIAGEKGQGYLRIIGSKSDGVWRLEELSLFARNDGYREIVLSKTPQ